MIIVGAGAAGKELLHGIRHEKPEITLCFFDDKIKDDKVLYGFEEYNVIKNLQAASEYLKDSDNRFIIANGHPRIKKKLINRFVKLGGINTSFISRKAYLLQGVIFKEGVIIHPSCFISFDTQIGVAVSIHVNTTVGHKVKIGNYTTIGPNCSIVGPCAIGDECYIGAGVTIVNGVSIGNNVIIGAGKTIKHDIEAYSILDD